MSKDLTEEELFIIDEALDLLAETYFESYCTSENQQNLKQARQVEHARLRLIGLDPREIQRQLDRRYPLESEATQ